MATSLVITAGPVKAALISRGKPRKIFRGVQRMMIRKTLAKLNALFNQDMRNWNRSLVVGYDPALVMGMENSVDGRAFQRVMARLQACLDMKEGDK